MRGPFNVPRSVISGCFTFPSAASRASSDARMVSEPGAKRPEGGSPEGFGADMIHDSNRSLPSGAWCKVIGKSGEIGEHGILELRPRLPAPEQLVRGEPCLDLQRLGERPSLAEAADEACDGSAAVPLEEVLDDRQ